MHHDEFKDSNAENPVIGLEDEAMSQSGQPATPKFDAKDDTYDNDTAMPATAPVETLCCRDVNGGIDDDILDMMAQDATAIHHPTATDLSDDGPFGHDETLC